MKVFRSTSLFAGCFFAMLTAQSALATDVAKCLDAQGPIEVSGKLTYQIFAGRPNFESIKNGDEEVHALILELDARQCLIDGEMSDPKDSFDRAHIYATDLGLQKILSSAEGRRIKVQGEGFASHTMHHRASLVIDVKRIIIE